ncbi:class I adenylate-forming enzyme family protein [Streptomyces sp. V4-01]|uniref:Class I adenylate-forming enzyme family protein n=1 Tax=Actinacidiphila polyblastidii TaxID=3110430 RepID=A0ABU7PIS2_9ACTN|nr:class I adenylate-forming enzyme family protein [Streptomyces sp. V4-01]
MAVLASAFGDALALHADRIALSDPDHLLTYRDLDRLAEEAGRWPAALAGAGGVVRAGIQAPNSAAYVVALLAMLRQGVVPFLIDGALGPEEVASIADQCSLDLLVHEADREPAQGTAAGALGAILELRVTALRRDGRRHALRPDTEVCRFTSGSTGHPHCIEFSGSAVSQAAVNWAAGTGLRSDDRIACFAALSNGLAFNTSLLAAFHVGASLHLTRGLPTGAHVSRVLERTAATWLVGFPALYEAAVRRGLDRSVFDRVRIAISSGAPLRPETRAAFTELTGVRISNYYGVAETGPLTFDPHPGAAAADDGADGAALGTLLPGVVMEAGGEAPAEIRVRSASMGSGYLNAPGLFEARVGADGLYRTGDHGVLRGRELFLTGRTSRMINFGGRKVDPVEVGNVLRLLPAVRDAVVFEVTDRHGSPAVAAAVVAEPGLDVPALRAHCRTSLAEYKVPGFFRLVDEIPANAIGKPSLDGLRRLVGADDHG